MAPRKTPSNQPRKRGRPALTPDSRENQLMSLAVDLAEQQLRDGTASSQIITHYLKLASSTERLQKDILEVQKELIIAKKDAIKSQKRTDEMYAKALKAMRNYSGQDDYPDED